MLHATKTIFCIKLLLSNRFLLKVSYLKFLKLSVNMLSFFSLHFSAILSYIPPIYYRFIIITFQNFIFPIFVASIIFLSLKFNCLLILLKLNHVLLFFFSIQQHFNSQFFFTLLKFFWFFHRLFFDFLIFAYQIFSKCFLYSHHALSLFFQLLPNVNQLNF